MMTDLVHVLITVCMLNQPCVEFRPHDGTKVCSTYLVDKAGNTLSVECNKPGESK